MSSSKTVFILGAGFSMNKGLPSQAGFAEALLSIRFDSNLDKCITVILKTFLEDTFSISHPEKYPTLEDIFTFIDISAGSGHNLGLKYPPNKLRAIRRMLIHRVFMILDDKYPVENDLVIHNFFDAIPDFARRPLDYSFVILNWDIVLEKELLAYPISSRIDYCCDGNNLDIRYAEQAAALDSLRLCKMHGSSNWVYCDNCRRLFFKLTEKQALIAKADINPHDYELFESDLSRVDLAFDYESNRQNDKDNCPCGNQLSYHIATFSYRKSFRNPAYSLIWSQAQRLLSSASNWVFIGYSLPAADFELKHLLKSAQLQGNPKKIIVIDKGERAKIEYERIFGTNIAYHGNTLNDTRTLHYLNSELSQ